MLNELVIGIVSAVVLSILGFIVARTRVRVTSRVRRRLALRQAQRFSLRMFSEGVSNFYVGRDEWLRYRTPSSLADYLRQARNSVQIACYWMAQGTLEGIPRVFAELAERGVIVEITMISPNSVLPEALSKDLEMSADAIRHHVNHGLGALGGLKLTLSENGKRNLRIKTSATLPQAAVILIDADSPPGKIQLEFRPYRAPRWNSFSIEVSEVGSARLYGTLKSSWQDFFRDATDI
ncbi:hypothetical protein [Streptomyces sp. Tu102]|uniref:hypothetical protein n=1 Tax=Streptomyces sp. Tu102 TaxID=2838019 RepID=UPI001BDCEF4F|nr:hypothetical protein [Streptomyces sp. Tu102]MBT1091604.1 hypothetical protein [Streptomyces sp. Tu102]